MTDEMSQDRGWWHLGARARPWLHALMAGGVGAGAAHFSQIVAGAIFFAGPAALAGLLAVTLVTGGALAALAVAGTGERRARWIGLEAVVLVPAALGSVLAPAFLGAATGGSGVVDLASTPLAFVVGAGLAAVPALLMHAGPARALGLIASAAAVVVVFGVVAVHTVEARDGAAPLERAAWWRWPGLSRAAAECQRPIGDMSG